MRKNTIHRLVSLVLCGLLIAASALTLTGCKDTKLEDFAAGADIIASYDPEKPLERGSGNTTFRFSVTDGKGTTSYWLIHTDKAIVGEALQVLGLIDGEEGIYGLYVKTVTGITIDPDKDRAYWAFYEGDSLAAAGVDKTAITPGATYSFRAESY